MSKALTDVIKRSHLIKQHSKSTDHTNKFESIYLIINVILIFVMAIFRRRAVIIRYSAKISIIIAPGVITRYAVLVI